MQKKIVFQANQRTKSLADVKRRFNAKIKHKGDCWEWQGYKDIDGYGNVTVSKRSYQAHRVSYWLHNQQDPGDMHVCHSCDNPSCVNPDHLWLGTNDDNVADKVAKGRHMTAGRPKGIPSAYRKLTEEQIEIIRSGVESDVALGKEFGVNSSTVRRARLKISYQEV